MSNKNLHLRLMLVLVPLFFAACERADWDPTVKVSSPKGHIVDKATYEERLRGRDMEGAEIARLGEPASKTAPTSEIMQRGTGKFIQTVKGVSVPQEAGDVTLNFDGTDIREVVKVVLGDLLRTNYILDPAVQGMATLQTGRPLKREHLLPTLETLLRMNQAALIVRDGNYQVVPLNNAIQGKVLPQLGESNTPLPAGYSVRVVPLTYIGAEEMSTILKPLVPEGSVVRIDELRNLLVIAGTSPEISNLLATIEVFDVDWMRGLSVGFFTLDFAKAPDVVKNLEALLSSEGASPLKGLFRFVPMESANSVLVISPRQEYLADAKKWIERLDQAEAQSGEGTQRLFVYRVRHGDAENLANIVSDIFAGDQSTAKRRAAGGVAPGLTRTAVESKPLESNQAEVRETRPTTATTAPSSVKASIALSSEVGIVADVVNNSLLIKATPRDYQTVLDALKQLDIQPLQVLVEATIIEIELVGSLRYGVQWQAFGTKGTYKNEFSYSTADSPTASVDEAGDLLFGRQLPGFNWTVLANRATIRATLSALASDNLLNVLSSPSVMVLDNQTAKIQVGEEVPTVTAQQQSTVGQSNIVNSIQYRDTGVILTVKPRVTPGGLVNMEIEQEVSTVSDETVEGLDSPVFRTRNIQSSVAVKSNQAVVLGGLIEDRRRDGQEGIPGLYKAPIVGWLFGETAKRAERTELVVVLTPSVISSDKDIEAVTEDFRNKLKGLKGAF